MRKHRMFNVNMITDDNFTSLSPTAQLLYLRLIAIADDDGFVGNLKMLSPKKHYLNELISAGLLHQFDSKHVLILHWFCHNCVKISHKKDTMYQDEKALVILDEQGVYRLKKEEENSGIFPPKEKEIKENKIKENKRESSAPPVLSQSLNSLSHKESDFNLFWDAYPNKSGKEQAFKSFQFVDVPVTVLLSALEKHKMQPYWINDDGQFIPKASNWLKKRRWEDDLVTVSSPPAPTGATGHLGAEELAAIQRIMTDV